MTADLAFVADASDRILAGESPSPPGDRTLEEVLDRLRDCETELSRKIAYPGTARLRRLHALLVDACVALEGVAAGGSRILVDGADPDLVEDWRARWTDAERLLLAVDRHLARFDPAYQPPLPVRAGATQTSRVEPRFGKVATALAGKRVRVRCWSREDWGQLIQQESLYTGGAVTAQHLGFAAVGGSDVSLAPDICLGLTVLVYGGVRPSGGDEKALAALSFGTLAHESYHSRGLADERTTECFAMQTVARTARLLGVERSYARDLARVYWRQVYRFETHAYRTRACRPDGPLDLRPKRAAWP
jgi:hypothetical protein